MSEVSAQSAATGVGFANGTLERPSWALAWRLLLAALALIGAGLRLEQYLFNRSLWLDEASLALSFMDRDVIQVLTVPLLSNQSAPPGFLALVSLATAIFGTSDWSLRLVPLLTGLATLPLAVVLANRAFASGIAKIAFVGFIALSPVLVYYSSEFKPYSSDALVTLALLCALAYRDTRHGTLILAVTGFVGIICSLPAVFLVAPAGCLLLWEAFRQRAWRRVAIVFACWAAAGAVHGAYLLFAGVKRQDMLAFWQGQFAPFPPHTRNDYLWYPRYLAGLIYIAFRQVGTAYHWVLSEWSDWKSWALTLLVCDATLVALFSRRALAVISFAAFVLTVLAAILFVYPFSGRLLIFLVPMVFFVIATAIDQVTRLSTIAGGILVICLLALPVQLAFATAQTPLATPDMRELLRKVQERRQPGDAIAVSGWSDSMYAFYAPQFGLDKSRYFTVPWENKFEDLMGPPEANHYGRVWFLLAFFTYQADGLIAKASAQVPVLYDWQQDGARLVLFDFGSEKRN